MGRLHGVLQLVLSVGGPELQATDHFDDLGMESGHTRFVRRRVAFFADLLLDLLLRLGDNLLDARRMNASVLYELGQREPRDFSPDRVEA